MHLLAAPAARAPAALLAAGRHQPDAVVLLPAGARPVPPPVLHRHHVHTGASARAAPLLGRHRLPGDHS